MKNHRKGMISFIFMLLMGLFFSACGLAESDQATEVPESAPLSAEEDYWIRIQNVQVQEKESIEFSGSTNVPEGNCLFTELFGDDVLVSWWPIGKCFPSTGGDWQFSVALGEESAPDQLDREVQYVLLVYWPGAPDDVRTAFPFDLAPPPSQ